MATTLRYSITTTIVKTKTGFAVHDVIKFEGTRRPPRKIIRFEGTETQCKRVQKEIGTYWRKKLTEEGPRLSS